MEIFRSKWHCTLYMESRQGGRNENQDYCLFQDTHFGLLAVVCDGMGGGPSGALASSLAAQAIQHYVKNAPQAKTPDTVLAEAVHYANQCLRNHVRENRQLLGMGTTCVAALVTARKLIAVHIGDSRLYHLRDTTTVMRTADHSVVGEMVRNGELTEEEARRAEMSNVVTKVLGISDNIEPETDTSILQQGDRIVLCTDGVWGKLPEDILTARLSRKGDVRDSVHSLLDDIEAHAEADYDNLSLCIVKVNYKNENQQLILNNKTTDDGRENENNKRREKKTTKLIIPLLTLLCMASAALNIFLLADRNEAKPVYYPYEVTEKTEKEQPEQRLNLEYAKSRNKEYEDSIKLLKDMVDKSSDHCIKDILKEVKHLQNENNGDTKQIIQNKRDRQNRILDNIGKCKKQYQQNINKLKEVEKKIRTSKIVETKQNGEPSDDARQMIEIVTNDLKTIK